MLPHPLQLEILDFSAYSLIVDARSPREFAEDHLPGAVNLPVVDDQQFAEVGTLHRTDAFRAYQVGVEHSMRNIANQLPQVATVGAKDRFLVYCFRGGKRSKLWADTLRTIGYHVDVLRGGWKSYRRWVINALTSLPRQLNLVVVTGPTGAGKTRLLQALRDQGEQVVDLEALAGHRGSLIGAIPATVQPTQKQFDSDLLQALRSLDPSRRIWIEDESKKIGNVQLPEALHSAIQFAPRLEVTADMAQRVLLWREDYPNLAADPVQMVSTLAAIRPLVGGEEYAAWQTLALESKVDELFERVMVKHYDPCYARTAKRSHSPQASTIQLHLADMSTAGLQAAAQRAVELASTLGPGRETD